MPFIARVTALVIVFVGGFASLALPALAHIDPDPGDAPAGSEQSVGFTVEHGCSGSPTVELQMRLADGIETATPQPLAGWTGAIDGNVVSFTGGPLAADVEETFRVLVVLPLTPGATIYFPFVQRCEVGEIAWIDNPRDGSGTELGEPAPAMRLTAALPGNVAPSFVPATVPATAPAPTTPQTTFVPTTVAIGSTDTVNPTVATTAATVSAADSTLQSQLNAPASAEADESTGSGGEVVFYAAIVVIVAALVLVLARARRKR